MCDNADTAPLAQLEPLAFGRHGRLHEQTATAPLVTANDRIISVAGPLV